MKTLALLAALALTWQPNEAWPRLTDNNSSIPSTADTDVLAVDCYGWCDKTFTTSIDRVVHVQVCFDCHGDCTQPCGVEYQEFDLNGYRDEKVMSVIGQVCYRSRVDGYDWCEWISGGCLTSNITCWGKR